MEKTDQLEKLEQMLKEAQKGLAKVDKKYVQYENPGHLFNYKINFQKFLENIYYILEKHGN